MASKISNISQALAAGNPRVADTKSNATADFLRSQGIAAAKRTGMTLGLPTPPNSISPNLPPIPYRMAKHPSESAGSPLSQVDSDIDLQDALDHDNTQDGVDAIADLGDDSVASDGMGTITAMLLAKHHLGEILLEKGPLAIRHMMNHLNQAVPGFSEIPPTKARRIVVAALENRSGGGARGEVEFEKVGWGRWDAHVKGQAPKAQRTMYPIREGGPVDPAKNTSGALRIPSNGVRRPSKTRRPSSGHSWTEHSLAARLEKLETSERSHKDVAEDEADKMSIDGDEEEEKRSPPPRPRYASRASTAANYSDTDEEDWASMGAEALRKGSCSTSTGNKSAIHSHMRMQLNRRPSAFASHPMSAPGASAIMQQHRQQQQRAQAAANAANSVDFTGMDVDQQERDAISALLKMGSL